MLNYMRFLTTVALMFALTIVAGTKLISSPPLFAADTVDAPNEPFDDDDDDGINDNDDDDDGINDNDDDGINDNDDDGINDNDDDGINDNDDDGINDNDDDNDSTTSPSRYGRIDSFPASLIGTWVIDGVSYQAQGTTRFEIDHGTFVVGRCVEVYYVTTSTPYPAIEIETEQDSHCSGSNSPSTPVVNPTTTPQSTVSRYGRINSYPASLIGTWVIDGVSYQAQGTTRFEMSNGAFATGGCVEIEYITTTTPYTAIEIETEQDYHCSGSSSPSTPVVNPTSTSQSTINRYGRINSYPITLIGTWVIDNVSYQAQGTTQFSMSDGAFTVGRCVEVYYVTTTTPYTAVKIETEQDSHCSGNSSTATPIAQPTSTPIAQPTTTATSQPTSTPIAQPTATATTPPTAVPQPTNTPTSVTTGNATVSVGRVSAAAGTQSVVVSIDLAALSTGRQADALLGAATLTLAYDPAIVNVASNNDCSGSSQFDLVLCDTSASDSVQINALSAAGVPANTKIVDITFQLLGQSGQSSALTLREATLSDIDTNPITTGIQNGEIAITGCTTGDVNCDGRVTIADVLYILQYNSGLRAASSEQPLPSGVVYMPACDANGDGQCNLIDGLLILQCATGMNNSLCPGGRSANVAAQIMNDDTTVTIGIDSISSMGGEEVTLPVIANISSGNLGVVAVEVRYNPDLLTLVACSADPGDQFDGGSCNNDFEVDGVNPDIVRFNLLSATGASGENLRLADLTFQVAGSLNGATQLDIEITESSDSASNSITPIVQDGEITAQSEGQTIFLPVVMR